MIRLRLQQFAVYWQNIGVDTYGKPKFAAPKQTACRWEDGISEVIGPDKINTLSTATVYLSIPVVAGGVLFLGKLADAAGISNTDPKADRRAREIINAGSVPSLKATQSLTTAYLK